MKLISLFILCLGFATVGHAQQFTGVLPEVSSDAIALEPREAQAVEDVTVAESMRAKDRFADRNCLRHTGSRVFRADRKGRKCAIGNGQAYTREDIENTGSMNLASALLRLHPGAR